MLVLVLGGIAPLSSQEPNEATVTTVELSEPMLSAGRLGGVAAGPDGTVYVSNFGQTVWRVRPDGHVEVAALGLVGSSGNAVDADGNLYQGSFMDNRIVRVAPDGTTDTYVSSGLDGPVGIAAAPDGSLYVVNCRANSVARVAPGGTVTTFARTPLFACPNGIAMDDEGTLFVVSFSNTHVVRITTDGTASLLATLPGEGLAHLAPVNGALYVTHIRGNRIYKVEADGSFEVFAGTGDSGRADGPALEAMIAHPNGSAAGPDGQSLYFNTILGEWRGDEPTELELRRIDLPSGTPAGPGA